MVRTAAIALAAGMLLLGTALPANAVTPTPAPTPVLVAASPASTVKPTVKPTTKPTVKPVPKPTSKPKPSPTPTSKPKPAAPKPAQHISWKKGKGDHTVTLSWKAPSGTKSGTKVHYSVETKVTLGKKKLAPYETANTTKTSVTYKNVPAGAKLKAEVDTAQRAAAGKHDYSPVWTQPQILPNVPQQVALNISAITGKVKWNAPKSDQGTLITGYTATIYAADLSSGKTTKGKSLTTDDSTRNVTFTKLKPQTNYYVFVQAINSKGKSKTAQSNNAMSGDAPLSTETPTPAPTPTFSDPVEVATPTPAASVLASTNVPQPSHTATSQATSVNTGMPPWLVLGLIGGVVLLVLGAAVYFIRKV